MNFLWMIFISLALAQILGFCIWWRRIGNRTRLRILLIGFFLAGNLPWPVFFIVFTRQDLPSTWITIQIFRLFATWQLGLILWLALAGLTRLAILAFFRLPATVIRQLNKRPVQDEPASPGRRVFFVKAVRGSVWGVALSSGAWGFVRAESCPRVVEYTISMAGLPQSMNNLTIAHLSDLHIGLWTSPSLVARVMALTRDLKPDLVVITGDIIDHRPSFSQTLVRHLYLLNRIPLGVYAIIGNHDVYTGADYISKTLDAGGIMMLRDCYHSFQNQGLRLALVGVDDPGRSCLGAGAGINLDRAMEGMTPDLFPILLTHRPTGFEQACDRKIPLTLCGHTHGGQIGLPGLFNLSDLAYEHTHGLYEWQRNFLHVSAGIGTIGLPIRVGVPAEIALLRLATPSSERRTIL